MSTAERSAVALVCLGLGLLAFGAFDLTTLSARAALLVSWAPHPHREAPAITWIADEEQGRAKAAAEHKPVLVVFNPSWCCKEVENDMFPDPRVREEARRFVAIAVDATDTEDPKTEALERKYEIVGLPAIVMFDSAGNEATRITSIVSPVTLAAEMRAVR